MNLSQMIGWRISVSVFLEYEEMIGMVQEADPRCLGTWNHPQGRVNEGEEPAVAAVREVWEEFGVESEIISEFATFTCEEDKFREICFHARPITPARTPKPQTVEILDARWYFQKNLLQRLDGKLRSPQTIRREQLRLRHRRRERFPRLGVIEIPPRVIISR